MPPLKDRGRAPKIALIRNLVTTKLPRQSEAHILNEKTQAPLGKSRNSLARIRILATSDLHMNLTGYDYYADSADPHIGFTRTASLIRQARQQAQDDKGLVLLVDNGDSLQGTPLGDWAAEVSPEAHPLPQAFAALGYDAVGLGNHDFGSGVAFLQHISKQSTYPMICSNAWCTNEPTPWQRWAILPRDIWLDGRPEPIRIGIFSVLPPQTAQWEAHKLNDQVGFRDILVAARESATELRKQGCDLVIALAHSGLGLGTAAPGLENAAIPLAEIDEIDAIVAGHTHLTLPGFAHDGLSAVDSTSGLVHGKPVVMPGWAGTHLGAIDLMLERDPAKKWRVAGTAVEVRAVHSGDGNATPNVPEDPETLRLLAKAHAATRARMAQPVGRVDQPLHSYFTYCAPDRGLALMAAAQATALRPYLRETPYGDLPVLSAVAPSKFGGRAGPRYYSDVPAGEISLRHLADLHVFPNELRAVVATGAQILDWLEMSAGIFNRLSSQDPQMLINPQRAGHNFDLLHGLSCQFDLAEPARFDAEGRIVNPTGTRVRSATVNGVAISADQAFVVATNNYRVNGGGGFPIADDPRLIPLPLLGVQEVLKGYLAQPRQSDPLEHAPRPFSFAPLDGVTAILKTGPKARKYLDELSEYAPNDLGLDDDGFLQIALTL